MFSVGETFWDYRFNFKCFYVYLNLQRLERQTRNMDPAQYAEFCESRQLSFGKILNGPLSICLRKLILS